MRGADWWNDLVWLHGRLACGVFRLAQLLHQSVDGTIAAYAVRHFTKPNWQVFANEDLARHWLALLSKLPFDPYPATLHLPLTILLYTLRRLANDGDVHRLPQETLFRLWSILPVVQDPAVRDSLRFCLICSTEAMMLLEQKVVPGIVPELLTALGDRHEYLWSVKQGAQWLCRAARALLRQSPEAFSTYTRFILNNWVGLPAELHEIFDLYRRVASAEQLIELLAQSPRAFILFGECLRAEDPEAYETLAALHHTNVH